MAALDGYLATFTSGFHGDDFGPHLDAYLFPHVRVLTDDVLCFATRDDVPPAFLRAGGVTDGFDHSEWIERRIVQASADRVHVATVFRRVATDGSTLATYTVLYILEPTADGWKVRGTSTIPS